MWSGTRPVAMSSPPSPGGATRLIAALGRQKYLSFPFLNLHSHPFPPPFCVCVSRWTMHTGCGRSRAVFFKRTIRTASVSCSGDPDLPPCSAWNRSRYHFIYTNCGYVCGASDDKKITFLTPRMRAALRLLILTLV